MKRLNRPRASTFMRFVCSYLIMLAVLLAFMLGCMYVYVEREVRDKTLDNHVNRLSRIADQHETYLADMVNSAVQMGLSPAIKPFVFDQNPAEAYSLLQQMAPYTVTNSFCDQMLLCFDIDDHIYSATSSLTLDLFLEMVKYERVSPEEMRALIRDPGKLTMLPSQKVESSLIDGNRTDMVTFLTPLGTGPGNKKGTIIYMLSANVFRAIFSDAIEDKNNTYVIHNGEILASAKAIDMPDATLLSFLGEADSRRAVEWNGESWYLLNYRSDAWDLNYVTVLQASDILLSAWGSMAGIFALFAVLAALGVLIALVLARRNTKPLNEIVSMLPGKTEGRDAFSSIQTGIRRLNESNTRLTTQLERSLPMQRHDFVVRFMKGRYAAREEAVAAAQNLGIMIDKPYYAIILHGVQDRSEHQPPDLRQPPFDELTGLTAVGAEMMTVKAYLYLVFSDARETIGAFARCVHRLGTERNGHAVVALSDVQTDFSAAPGAYLEAATAFENRFVMDESGLMYYAAISTSIEDLLPKARKLTDAIGQALSIRDRAMVSARIDELLTFLKHTNMSAFAFRLIYNDVIDKLLRRHDAKPVTNRGVQAYYDIFTLSSCQSIDDLDRLLRRLCDAFLDAGGGAAEIPEAEESSGVIGQVTTHIRAHFTDPELSIGAIAEAFDMPIARLSLAFKDVMHMSPLEYLTLLRVEHSKELLGETDLSIKDIAAEVGYYDASSFIRRFKQMTGVTPLQYRRSKEESP